MHHRILLISVWVHISPLWGGGGMYTAIDVVHAPESSWIFCRYLVDFCKHTNTVCWILMTCFCLTVVFDTWSFFLFFSFLTFYTAILHVLTQQVDILHMPAWKVQVLHVWTVKVDVFTCLHSNMFCNALFDSFHMYLYLPNNRWIFCLYKHYRWTFYMHVPVKSFS